MSGSGSLDPHVAAGLEKWRTSNAETRKLAIVEAITALTEKLGMAPLRREIAEHVEMDLKTVRRYLGELSEAGVIREPGGPRTRTLQVCPANVQEVAQDALNSNRTS